MAEKHGIEESLFHSSNLVKIYDLIGRKRQMTFMTQSLGKELTIKKKWQNIIGFLSNELRVREEVVLYEKSKVGKNDVNVKLKFVEDKHKAYNSTEYSKFAKCVLCGKTDHVATVTRRGKLVAVSEC